MAIADAIQRVYSFLKSAGFRSVPMKPCLWRYESGNVFVLISWDRCSGELEEYIGLLTRNGEREDSFSLTDILRMQGERLEERRPFEVYDENNVDKFLEILAQDTKVYAQLALAGDRSFIDRLKGFRDADGQRLMRDMRLSQIRTAATKAWSEHDFAKVAALYASMEGDLAESERAKLIYARKKIVS